MPASAINGSGIDISPLSSGGLALVAEINQIVDEIFVDPTSEKILSMEADTYFDLVLAAQTRVNKLDVIARLFRTEKAILDRVLHGAKGAAQRIAYLRAVRPVVGLSGEHVDFHRESFFNADMANAWNVWIPIRDVTPANSVRFVPGSQLIPEAEIETTNDGDEAGLVKRYSSGHKVGLLYDPKRIVSGVDFSTVETLYVPPGRIAVFDANLIHGAGVNNTGNIRFSLDFRIIRAENVRRHDYNFAADGEYFVEIG